VDTLETDVVFVGDFRFPGGTSTAIASEITALAQAGYRVALIAVANSFLSKTRSFNPVIAELIDTGAAILAKPGQAVKARLACLHHPAVFETLPLTGLKLFADQAVLIVHHPPFDADGTPEYDVAQIRRVLEAIVPAPVGWAPVGPKVRAQFKSMPNPPPLTETDWVNVVDVDMFGGPRTGTLSGRPVVGRHSRPSPLKWPDTPREMHAAYPVDEDIQVQLMGFDIRSVDGLRDIPSNWDIRPFNSENVDAFLRGIDYFSYFHSSKWVEAFGRSILEAMASGAICLLPHDFEPVFKEGAIYCKPDEVADIVRGYHAEPETYVRQSRIAVDFVRETYSPQVAVARVEERIGAPAKDLPTPATSQALKPRVLYFTSNGIGMGHLTRVLACARRHRDTAEPVVVSMSRAFSVARREGIMAEHVPFFRSSGMPEQTWHETLQTELTEIIGFYRPRVAVLDANVPYKGFINAAQSFPDMWSIWLRRAMWPPDVGAHFLEHEEAFDAVIEPGEIAAAFDRGLTVERRQDSKCVAPIGYLQHGEALDRGAARAVLDLDPERPAVFLQLGSGNNIPLAPLREAIFEKLSRDIQSDPPQIVLGAWQIGTQKLDVPDHVTVLTAFPFARFLHAFDYAVALAGYNTFHENLAAGLPTLFLGNEHPEQDEQWLRASYAEMRGCALAARTGNIYDVLQKLFDLSDPKMQAALRGACKRLPRANGADEAARYIADLAHTRRPLLAPVQT